MINLIEALRMSVVALRDTSGGEEMIARRKAALEAAERALDEELDSFLFGEGAIEVTIKTVQRGKMYGNRRVISGYAYEAIKHREQLITDNAARMWEEIEAFVERNKT